MPPEVLREEEIDILLKLMGESKGAVGDLGGAVDIDHMPENKDDLNFVPINPLSSFLSAKTNKSARIYMLTSDFVDKHHNHEDIGDLEEILRWLFMGKNKEVADTLKELIVEDGSVTSIKVLAARFLLISKILLETATEQLQKCENNIEELRQQKENACLLFIF